MAFNNLAVKLERAHQVMQVIQLGAIKLSFVFFFRRIFVVHKSSNFAILTASMIGIISIWIIAFFLTFLFACGHHLSAWWSPSSKTECVHTLAFQNGFTLSEFLMDAIIMAMPVPMVSPYLNRPPFFSPALRPLRFTCCLGMAASYDHWA